MVSARSTFGILSLLSLLSVLAVGAGCVDLEGAYDDCISSGRCGTDAGTTTSDGGTDAGVDTQTDGGPMTEPDSGVDAGMDAGIDPPGGDAGFDAGMDAGVVYDGGPACFGSMHPHLRCQAPIELGNGGTGLDYGVISANDDVFLVGWITPGTVELRAVALDGGVTPLATVPATQPRFAVAGKGSNWALVTVNSSAPVVNCLSSATDAGVAVLVPDGGLVDVVSIAVSETGGVGIAARNDQSSAPFYGAHDVNGCPGSLRLLPKGTIATDGVSVVHGASQVDDGFRYIRTGPFNFPNGRVEVSRLEADGGITTVGANVSGRAPDEHVSAASHSGESILVAFAQADSNADYSLGYLSTSTNLANDGSPQELFPDPGWWGVTACGPDCAAVSSIEYFNDGPIKVAFLSDTPGAVVKARWDAVCNIPAQSANGATLGVAHLDGKLGVLYVTPTSVKLHLCDVPPL